MILWLEKYAGRLDSGTYVVGDIISPLGYPAKAIRLFPMAGASNNNRVSRCVTRGIEVVASAVPAYEIGRTIYSVRIRLVEPGEDGSLSSSERGFETCQLRSRHWKITANDTGEEEHVRGDGGTGLYPLLFGDGRGICAGRSAADAANIPPRYEYD